MRTFAQQQHSLQPVHTSFGRPSTVGLVATHRQHPILQLQRMIGNHAVQRVIQTFPRERQAGLSGTLIPHLGREFSRIPIHPGAAGAIQPKLAINTPGDVYEQEADRVSGQVMRMSAPPLQHASACSEGCSEGQTEPAVQEKERVRVQRAGRDDAGLNDAPPIVQDVLQSPGQPLDPATRAFFEPRFGYDFGQVQVHTGSLAAQSADAVNALAYTVGNHVVFGAGRYSPTSHAGQSLLGHELTHVVQQGSAGESARLQRFQASERPLIAPEPADMLATIKGIIDASTRSDLLGDTVAMETFVQNAAGIPFTKELDKKLGTHSTPKVKSMLNYRYLFTCRCGLLDMRHFIQLLYISNFVASMSPGVDANRVATRKGREHELTSEAESRFGAEDTPSNALGAFTATRLAAYPRPGPLYDAIKDTIMSCDPISFKNLSPASQDMIVNFYGELIPDPKPKKPGDRIPKHQNETAVPDVLGIKECGGRERSFPFTLDTGDTDKKTLSGTAFEKGSAGLTRGRDIREFISVQRPEIIQALPTAEKIRLVKVLLSGSVDDDDRAAVQVIYNNSSTSEKVQIDQVKDLLSGMYGGQTFGGGFSD